MVTTRDLKKGILLLIRNKSYQAAEYFSKLIEKDPTCAYAWVYLSAAYYNNRNFEKSYLASNVVLRLEPQNRSIYIIRGSIFLEWGLYQLAINCFDKYLLEVPNDHEILSQKAYCHYTLYQLKETVECFDRIIALVADNKEILEQRSKVIDEQQNSQAIPAA